MGVFNDLFAVNVNDHVEQKNNLTYLSWAWAWPEVKKRYPKASYTVWKDENGLPYVYDENTGYMVYTSVTIEDVTHEMWLPVMDGANKAMKSKPYTYDTKYKKGLVVEAATMFDVNKAIMRCLVKNLAMFGLGLYIYAGEDLPNVETEKAELIDGKQKAQVLAEINRTGIMPPVILKEYNIETLDDMTVTQFENCMKKFSVTKSAE